MWYFAKTLRKETHGISKPNLSSRSHGGWLARARSPGPSHSRASHSISIIDVSPQDRTEDHSPPQAPKSAAAVDAMRRVAAARACLRKAFLYRFDPRLRIGRSRQLGNPGRRFLQHALRRDFQSSAAIRAQHDQ